MTINFESAATNFALDFERYLCDSDKQNTNEIKYLLIGRVAGIALAALSSLAAVSALTALSSASLAFLPLTALSAVLLVGGHDIFKISDNISQEMNPLNNCGSIAKNYLKGAVKQTPPAFVDTLISYKTYNSIFKALF